MLKRYIILFAVLVECTLCVLPARGQFVTKRLALLYQATGIVLNDSVMRVSKQHDFDSIYYFRNHPIHIKTNPLGEISHLGYSLFGADIRQKNPPVAYDFIERYFLELDLDGNDVKRQLRLKKDGVVCAGNPISLISGKSKMESITINNEVNHKYIIELQRGDSHLAMAFNADYQLILGADDIELEEILAKKIRMIASEHNYTGDFKLIFDRYGYVKDTIAFSRQDIIKLIEEETEDHSFQSKTETEDVLFAINRELGFVHLATFMPNQVRLIAYIPIHDASDFFISQMVPTNNYEKTQGVPLDIPEVPLDIPLVESTTEANTDNY